MKFEPTKATIARKMTGAASGPLADCHSLAQEAWGDAAENGDSGLMSFAYLYRRFGPPSHAGDPGKDIAAWLLTTPDPSVALFIAPAGCAISYKVGYRVTMDVAEEFGRPTQRWFIRFEKWLTKRMGRKPTGQERLNAQFHEPTWSAALRALPGLPRTYFADWRKGPPVMRRVNRALLVTMRDLLTPVAIRDTDINLFGRIN